MLKKRIILTLLMNNAGVFFNSRSFRLQAVGELIWIKQYLDFESIDELVLLNVQRGQKDINAFARHMIELGRECFVPISAGGGVRTAEDFNVLLDAGADKVVVNSAAYHQPSFITEAARRYGSQCVIASIDCRRDSNGRYLCYADDGTRPTGREALQWASNLEELGAGEILIRSMERDGCAQGYDLELVRAVSHAVTIPVIAAGGVGELAHLSEGILKGDASAVSAGNLFHYIGKSLMKAKKHMREDGLDLPIWNFM